MEDDADDAYVIQLAGDPEDRRPENTRVLERRKSKEGEAGGKVPLTLHTAADGGAVIDADPATFGTLLAMSGGRSAVKEDPVLRIVRLLDQHEVPRTLGRDAVKLWCEERGIELNASNRDLSPAIKARKERDALKEEVSDG